MKALLLCLTLFHFTLRVGAESFENIEWVATKVRDGVTLFQGKVNGTDVVAFKGSGIIEAPIWKLAAIFLDGKRAPEWVDSLAKSHIVRRLSPTRFIEYNHIETPFVMKDRDFVSLVNLELDPQGRTFALHYEPTDDISVPKTNHVRGEIKHGLFKLKATEDPEKTLLVAEMHTDPKGSVPIWIVNLFQKNWPLNTFDAIRAQVKKLDIGIPEDFKTIVFQVKDFAEPHSSLSR